MSLDPKLLSDFIAESRRIIASLKAILASVQGDMNQALKLQDFGNQVDRIMGAAQSLALAMSDDHALDLISEYSALCKTLAYKTSAIKNNEKNNEKSSAEFYELCVNLLKDGTNTLEVLIQRMNDPFEDLNRAVSATMVERFRWVSEQMAAEAKTAPKDDKKMSQDDIDEMFKKLGM